MIRMVVGSSALPGRTDAEVPGPQTIRVGLQGCADYVRAMQAAESPGQG